MSAEELIKQYREMVICWSEALGRGKIRKANRLSGQRKRLSQQLRSSQPDVQHAFLALLDDNNAWVRYDAATDALAFAPEKAVPVLEQIANGPPGPVRLDAEMVLAQWRDGTLHLP